MNRFWARLTTCALIAATGFLYATSVRATDYTHQDTLADTNSGDVGYTDGAQKFVVRRDRDKRYFDVYFRDNHLFTVKEQSVDLCGGSTGLIEDYAHVFYLSPDHRHLFVEQKGLHCYGVGTLYGPGRGGNVEAIRPHGMPFDSAAIHAFEHVMHLPDGQYGHLNDDGQEEGFGDNTRVIHFERWTPGGLDFDMALANFYCGSGPDSKGDVEYDWSAHYDFRTARFTRIHVTNVYTHAEYEKERARDGR